jgi:hypothetical protein
LNLSAPKKKKAFGRGWYWPATISGNAYDADVDASEGQARIKVELIALVNGGEQVLKTANVNSTGNYSFTVEHELVDPFFGQPKRRGELQQGENRLKVRVWDAYEGKTYVDLPEVRVTVQD